MTIDKSHANRHTKTALCGFEIKMEKKDFIIREEFAKLRACNCNIDIDKILNNLNAFVFSKELPDTEIYDDIIDEYIRNVILPENPLLTTSEDKICFHRFPDDEFLNYKKNESFPRCHTFHLRCTHCHKDYSLSTSSDGWVEVDEYPEYEDKTYFFKSGKQPIFFIDCITDCSSIPYIPIFEEDGCGDGFIREISCI